MHSKLNLHVENTGVLPILSKNRSGTAVYRNTAVFIHKHKHIC